MNKETEKGFFFVKPKKYPKEKKKALKQTCQLMVM